MVSSDKKGSSDVEEINHVEGPTEFLNVSPRGARDCTIEDLYKLHRVHMDHLINDNQRV